MKTKLRGATYKIDREPDTKWRFRHTARLVVVISGVVGALILIKALINGFL